jgi:dUTP pyrophosphatase
LTDSAPVTVHVVRLPHGADLDLPAYATEHSAGLDLVAAVAHDTIIQPASTALIPTGLAIALPPGFEAQVRPRSGLALKNSVTVLNSPGTIDSDYRGEVGVIMINHGAEPFRITRGMRLAQLVLARVAQLKWSETKELPASTRGAGGFGSTGR